jgi:hypothetical protein
MVEAFGGRFTDEDVAFEKCMEYPRRKSAVAAAIYGDKICAGR